MNLKDILPGLIGDSSVREREYVLNRRNLSAVTAVRKAVLQRTHGHSERSVTEGDEDGSSVIRLQPVHYSIMTTDSQTLIEAVKAGEMTDAGGMTTTQDVADVVPDSYETVVEKLRALEREGAIESKTFGNERVWIVTEDTDDMDEKPTETPIPTDTRAPLDM